MAFAIPLVAEGVAEAGTIGAGIFDSLFGAASVAEGATAATAVAEGGAAETALTGSVLGTAATDTIVPSVAAEGLEATGMPSVATAGEDSLKTLWTKLPKLKMTTKVVGGGVAGLAGGHLVQNLYQKHQSLLEGLKNVPGGIVGDMEDLADFGGDSIGRVVGHGVKSATSGMFGELPSWLPEVLMIGGGLYLFTKLKK